jgi:hypothetical protein
VKVILFVKKVWTLLPKEFALRVAAACCGRKTVFILLFLEETAKHRLNCQKWRQLRENGAGMSRPTRRNCASR